MIISIPSYWIYFFKDYIISVRYTNISIKLVYFKVFMWIMAHFA
jgi:hypothetical protein